MTTSQTPRAGDSPMSDGAAAPRRRVAMAAVVLALLAASAIAVVIATTLMPESYSWVRHSVSESAGQGVEDAWVARLEDFLHSVTASTVGFAFTVGLLFVALRRGPGTTAARVFDGFAVISALVISMLVVNVAGLAGLAQRIMFGIGYVWFGLEAIRAARTPAPHPLAILETRSAAGSAVAA